MLQDGLHRLVEGLLAAGSPVPVQPPRQRPQEGPVQVDVCLAVPQVKQLLGILRPAAAHGSCDVLVHGHQAWAQVLIDPQILQGLQACSLRELVDLLAPQDVVLTLRGASQQLSRLQIGLLIYFSVGAGGGSLRACPPGTSPACTIQPVDMIIASVTSVL